MANDRMYLKCNICGETLLLGKFNGADWWNFEDFGKKYLDFLEKHGDIGHHNSKYQCFKLEYEISKETK